LFFYNVNGMTGKFIIDKNHNIVQIPKTDNKIIIDYINPVDGEFQKFKIITVDGTIYTFGYNSSTNENPAVQRMFVVGQTHNHIDTWKLKSIESFDKKHVINFEYTLHRYKYKVTVYPNRKFKL